MAQIFEISKYSNRYLIHHFKFECNDGKAFGNCTGNWTLNKFMSLHDWHQVFDTLSAPIQQYMENPIKRPPQMQRHIGDTHFELNIAWIKMDASIYPKLFSEIDFSLVFPYVIKVMVSLRSNIDKFNRMDDVSVESTAPDAVAVTASIAEAVAATPPNRKRTPKRNVVAKRSQEPPILANGLAHKPIQMRECCVRLPLLQFDENGQVIQEQQQQPTQPTRNPKRKFSSMANDEKIHSLKMTPIRNGGESSGSGVICADDTHDFKFKCSSSSTPFIRNVVAAASNSSTDDSGSAKQKRIPPLPAQRLTISTPVSSQERKAGSLQFNPRIRLLKMPENVSKLNISVKKSKHKIRELDKKSTKINGKMKTAAGKRIKKKKRIRSVPNESQLFETPPPNRKQKKVPTGENAAATVNDDDDRGGGGGATAVNSSVLVTISPPTIVLTTPSTPEKVNNDSEVMAVTPCNGTVKLEDLDLKSLTEPELWKSFDDNFELISNLFLNYLRQTNAAVKTAGDYEPFDIISLLTTDQFSVMLDILFEKLVKIGEFGEIQYDTLFMKSLIPEWILSIFMHRNSMDRKTALDKIMAQKLQSDQNREQYTSLINVRLDDTANLTRI